MFTPEALIEVPDDTTLLESWVSTVALTVPHDESVAPVPTRSTTSSILAMEPFQAGILHQNRDL